MKPVAKQWGGRWAGWASPEAPEFQAKINKNNSAVSLQW